MRQRSGAWGRRAEDAAPREPAPPAADVAPRRAETPLEDLVEGAPVGLHSLNRDGVVVRMNRTELGWLGRSADEVLGRPYADLLDPASRPVLREAMQRLAAEGHVRDVPLDLVDREGRRRPVCLTANLVRDAAGAIVATRSIVAEAEAHLAAVRYRRLVDSVNAIVWEGDADTLDFHYVSPSAERVLGYPAEAWTKPGFWDSHIHPDDRSWAGEYCRTRAATGAPHELLYRMIAADGRVVWLHDVVAVERPPGGPSRLYGVMIDVTGPKEAEERLAQAYALLESALESTADGLLVVDRAGRIVRCNQRFAAMWGIAPELLASRDDAAVVASVLDRIVDPEGFLAGLRHLYEHVEEESFDTVRLRDGRVFERYSIPHRLGGEVVGRVWSFRDVTARDASESALRSSEARLLESERRMATVASLSPVGIFRTDAQGRFVYVNRGWTDLCGLCAEAAIGADWFVCVHPDDQARVVEAWAQAAPSRERFRAELRLVQPDGTVRWVQGEAVAERGPDDAVIGYVGAATDITERVAAEAELRRHQETLEQRVAERTRELTLAVEELETFSYTVSHDLRAPLRAIDGYARLLHERAASRLEPADREALDRVARAAARMSRLIDDTLALCRLGRAALHPSEVDVSALAREIVEDLRGTAPERDVDVVVQDGLVATADPGLLRIVLENLLGNAWKFTGKQASARVELWAEDVDGERVFHVRDDGAGFDPALAARLFQPFQRLHAGGAFEGTGVGLATVRRIVERHGGRVWAEGAPDRGATFSFALPRHPPVAPRAGAPPG